MAQVWYIGPLAKQVGEYGADVSETTSPQKTKYADRMQMGNYVGFAWAALVYPALRWFELKKFGR